MTIGPGRKALFGLMLGATLAGCTVLTGPPPNRTPEDAQVTAAVKAKLVAEKATKLTGVNVATLNGTVTLTGTVPDGAARQRAASLTREVDGVVAVENDLEAAPPAGDAPGPDRPANNNF